MLTIGLVGPFQIIGAGGDDLTPKGRKTRALLALLALSPGYRRSRAWLQDKLWSDRAEQQGAASLRQSLAEIRRTLGSDKDIFKTSNQTVQLDPKAIVLSFDHGSNIAVDDIELLEGLDVPDPEFEDWLREQRRVFRDRRASNAVARTNVSLETRSNDISKATIRLYVRSQVPDELDGTEVLTCAVSDMMAKSIKELLSAEVIDQRKIATTLEREPAITDVDALELTSKFVSVNGLELFRFSLTHTLDNTVIWTDAVPCQSLFEQGADATEPLRHVNQVANIAAGFVANAAPNNRPERLALHYCQLGVSHLFRLGRANFEAADRLFSQAYDLHPRGLFLGWRAYLRLFMHAERQFLCRQTLDEEAVEYAAKAMELEPYNSVVTSLAAHVHLTVRRSYASAYELAEQSIQLNRANSLGWLALGVAQCHLGELDEGFRKTLFAREICGLAPYRFQVDGLCCIAATVAGNFDHAIRLGEISHARAPMFAPALRFLIALYSHQGSSDLAFEAINKLKRIEPDFSFELLKEQGYPAASLRRTSLLDAPVHRQI